ncbi:hypothetical protein [Deefgea piscis]|uniref:hypothetical protein n=1 Tax=Deefgea piscis TaxID=2739061 RepID=UPI001C8171B4|nr:hypothetical protein [Deefgea piscis]QZA80707.1 hypothetical protein K4H25_14575 [Deefgea piscis]
MFEINPEMWQKVRNYTENSPSLGERKQGIPCQYTQIALNLGAFELTSSMQDQSGCSIYLALLG